MKRTAFIGLGSNQGDIVEALNSAIDSLRSIEQTEFSAVSPYYRSAPIDAPGPDYLNAVVKVETALEPYALLLHLLDIELMLGRKRRGLKKNAPRSISPKGSDPIDDTQVKTLEKLIKKLGEETADF